MAHTVYIALGSNLGDRAANLAAARAGMEAAIHINEASQVYETPPWGIEDQPVFLNQVVKGETELSPEELLTFLKRLERHKCASPLPTPTVAIARVLK